MKDSFWDGITGDAAHEIEVLNYLNQVNVIEALVRFLLHHNPPNGETGCAACPSQRVLKELHRTATLFLLQSAGEYRSEQVFVKSGETVVHTPPAPEQVGDYLDRFFNDLEALWPTSDAYTIAAFCLWFVNWVHPFKNGNGRTARAFSYACLELKLGFILPGSKTVIDLIMENRIEYQDALKVADQSFEANGSLDLSPMVVMISRLLEQQLSELDT